MAVVSELRVVASFAKSSDAMGVPRATYYRGRKPTCPGAERWPHPAAITASERNAVISELTSERFWDVTVPQVFATLLDEGQYFCSVSSMY